MRFLLLCILLWTQVATATPRVFLSLTTLPERVKALPHVLASVDLMGVEEVIISIPNEYKGQDYPSDKEFEACFPPEARKKMVLLRRAAGDLGPIMKLTPPLRYLHNKLGDDVNLAVLVTIDDDTIYSQFVFNKLNLKTSDSMLSSMAAMVLSTASQEKLPVSKFALSALDRNCVQSAGCYVHPRGGVTWDFEEDTIVAGFSGVAYPLTHLSLDVIERMEAASQYTPDTRLSDDLVIGRTLRISGVPLHFNEVPYYCAPIDSTLPEILEEEIRQQPTDEQMPNLHMLTMLRSLCRQKPFMTFSERLMGKRVEGVLPCPEERERYMRADQDLKKFFSKPEE